MLTTRYRFTRSLNSSADAAETHLLQSCALLLPRRQRKSIGGNSSRARTGHDSRADAYDYKLTFIPVKSFILLEKES